MVGMKLDVEMVTFSFYDFLCAFLCASKFLFFLFISDLKQPLIYRSRTI